MNTGFSHQALSLTADKLLVYTAFSKHLFYYRTHISKFVLEKGFVPLNPFMSFDYFLLDTLPRDVIREANNNLVKRCDELWVFGSISDGVWAEITIATALHKSIRFFAIEQSQRIVPCTMDDLPIENHLAKQKTQNATV